MRWSTTSVSETGTEEETRVLATKEREQVLDPVGNGPRTTESVLSNERTKINGARQSHDAIGC